MTVNQVIYKYVSDESIRHIIFSIKKKCSDKVIDTDQFFKICDQSVYYVCKVINHFGYSTYKFIKESIFERMTDLKILEFSKEGIRFRD